jgi:hypothetical protein
MARAPIGAKVRLTGIGPLANGAPSFVIRGGRQRPGPHV